MSTDDRGETPSIPRVTTMTPLPARPAREAETPHEHASRVALITEIVKRDLPTTREVALALTKLDEARLWLMEADRVGVTR